MNIHGEFNDYNGVKYEVYILTNDDKSTEKIIGDSGDTCDLWFAEEPVEIETDNDDTFEHLIRKSAKISLVTSKYLGDTLWGANAHSVKVEIFQTIGEGDEAERKCIFYGYAEPNSYEQPFLEPYDEFELNCIDCLSTLQYYNYDKVTPSTYSEYKKKTSTFSFQDMLFDILNDYIEADWVDTVEAHVYYDCSKGITSARTNTIFQDVGINDSYIYGDEYDDIWTQEDVLKEMLQYLNLHMIQDGRDFYIFDWNTIKSGNNRFYDLVNKQYVSAKSSLEKTITSDIYGKDDTDITVADVYNQIQVTCDLETQDTVVTSPLDTDSLSSLYTGKQLYMTEFISEGEGQTAIKAFNNMLTDNATDYDKASQIDWYIQPYISANWSFQTPDKKDITSIYSTDSNGKYDYMCQIPLYLKNHQCTPCIFKMGSVERKAQKSDNSPQTSKVDMDTYLFISVNGNENDTESGHSPSDETLQACSPIITYVGGNSGGVYSPTDDETTNYLVFSGEMLMQATAKETDTYYNCWYAAKNDAYKYWHKTVPSDNNDDGRYYTRKFYNGQYPSSTVTTTQPTGDITDTTFLYVPSMQPWTKDKASHLYKYNYSAKGESDDKIWKIPILECELIIGTKRLVETDMDEYGKSTFKWVTIGEEPKWTDTDGTQYTITTFTLGPNPKIGDYILGEETEIQNTVDYRMNLDEEGTAIPIKKSDNLHGAVQFKILGVCNLLYNDITRRHPSFWRHTKWTDNSHFLLSHMENVILKSFECKICTDSGGNTIDEDNDLIYVSDETDNFIEKKDDIDFKFITQLSSQECYEKGLSQSVNLNAVVDMTTNSPLTSLYNATTNETAKAEEHYVDQYYTEYCKPRLEMETVFQNTYNTVDWRHTYKSTILNKTFFVESTTYSLREATVEIKLKEI